MLVGLGQYQQSPTGSILEQDGLLVQAWTALISADFSRNGITSIDESVVSVIISM